MLRRIVEIRAIDVLLVFKNCYEEYLNTEKGILEVSSLVTNPPLRVQAYWALPKREL